MHSCDRYEFLYKGFEYFFFRHWDFKIPCQYYFATEEKSIDIKGFQNIRSGKGEWADRLAFLLREKITEKYVLYFQEDMWLNKKINAGFFVRLFELAEKNNWQLVKLHSSDVYTTIATDTYIEGFNISKIDNKKSDYLMSHQVSLWNREFLLAQLNKNEHPWRNERRGTKRLKRLNPDIIQIDYFAENGNAEINKNDHPVLRSEYRTISTNGILNDNISSYLDDLKQSSAYPEYAAKLEYNFNNKLTHDGKPKPKKTDIFKRAKNWIKDL